MAPRSESDREKLVRSLRIQAVALRGQGFKAFPDVLEVAADEIEELSAELKRVKK